MKSRVVVLTALAVGILVVVELLSGGGRRPPAPAAPGEDPAPAPETASPEPKSLAHYFVVRPAPGVEVHGPVGVTFAQPRTGRRVTARFVPGEPSVVMLDPDEVDLWLSPARAGRAISPRQLDLPGEPPDEPWILTLSATGDLRLRLENGKTGEVLEGMSLGVEATGDLEVSEREVADDSGVILFRGLPTGSYRVYLQDLRWTTDPAGLRIEHPDLVLRVRAGGETERELVLFPLEEPVYELRVEVTVDGGPPLPHTRPRPRVFWLGTIWQPPEIRPGVFHEFRARDGAMGDPDREIVLAIRGRGVEGLRRVYPPDVVVGDRLVLRADVRGLYGEARGVLVDERGRPIPGREFRLHLISEGKGRFEGRLVETDENGEFRVRGVRFPLGYYASNDSPGERLVPSDAETRYVAEGTVLKVVRHRRNEVLLALSDPEEVEARFEASPATMLEVTPLSEVRSRIRPTWDSGGPLTPPASRSAGEPGRISLGDLPAGRYAAWMLVGAAGSWNGEFRVSGELRTDEVDVSIHPVREPIEGRLTRHGLPVSEAFVIDGSVPHYLAYELPKTLSRALRRGSGDPGLCFAAADADGSFCLAVHNADNPRITVVVGGEEVFHLEKRDLEGREEIPLIDHPEDVLLEGRILDEEGRGVAGLRVALSPLGGADARVLAPVPSPRHVHPAPTSEDGAFAIRGVRPGTWLFSVCRAHRTEETETLVFLPEKTRILDVTELPPDGLRIVLSEEERKRLQEPPGHEHR